jgi:PPOX class probable F420-dependent enzyme
MVPTSHLDLIEGPLVVTLATAFPDGQPQMTAVWCSYDGTHVAVVTSRGLQKEKNMQLNPRVSILALDPENPYRYLEIRGTVDEITEIGAIDKLDEHTRLYTGNPTYYGHIVAAEELGSRAHVVCRIRPSKVITNG